MVRDCALSRQPPWYPGAECWRLILSPIGQKRNVWPIFIRERVGLIVGAEMQDDENA
jgi:hypothetical protein